MKLKKNKELNKKTVKIIKMVDLLLKNKLQDNHISKKTMELKVKWLGFLRIGEK